jgi:hypothetical protein
MNIEYNPAMKHLERKLSSDPYFREALKRLNEELEDANDRRLSSMWFFESSDLILTEFTRRLKARFKARTWRRGPRYGKKLK